MRHFLLVVVLLAQAVVADAAINLAVSQHSGTAAAKQAEQLARRIGDRLATPVNVVVLADAAQVEAWLNRFAAAELALVESDFVSARAGRFLVVGPAGGNLLLVGRQGISGELPQQLAPLLAAKPSAPAPAGKPRPASGGKRPDGPPATAAPAFSPSKSVEEDRYFVGYVYREKLHLTPAKDRVDYWTAQLQEGKVTKQQLYDMACRPEEKGCSFR